MSNRRILIDAVYPEETRVVIFENGRIDQFDYETTAKKQIKGNIYLAKVTRVEPSLQAAFVEYGSGKQGFLPFAEIHPDYYQIPVADRQRLMEEVMNLSKNDEEEEDDDHFEEASALTGDDHPDDEPLEEGRDRDYALEPSYENTAVTRDSGDGDAPDESAAAEPEQEEERRGGRDRDRGRGRRRGRGRGRNRHQQDDSGEDGGFAGGSGIDDDEEEGSVSRSYWELLRKYKIQEVIKRNQIILVQVIKEERGNKGATLTTYISLAGRYCVLKPNSPRQGGISRKIGNVEDRRNLRSLLSDLNLPQGTSIIIRTAGAGRNKLEIRQDYEYLVRLWNNIREQTLSSSAPAFIHSEGDLIKRTIRDWLEDSIDEALVQGDEAYHSAKEFVKLTLPDLAAKVKPYKNNVPLFSRYRVEEQLAELYSPVANLKSGGYVVIDPTEALVSIDVNSGRSTSERNVEETALKTNLEAAREIARQLRLRDLSGLIVIDFIDMLESRNRRAIERALREAFYRDRAKVQLGRISTFGLMELSRQRLRSSFYESNTTPCPTCEGRGRVRAPESTAVMILRAIESEMSQDKYEEIDVLTAPEVASYIFNFKRQEVAALEHRHRVNIFVHADTQSGNDTFAIEPKKYGTRKVAKIAPLAAEVVVSYEEIRQEYPEEAELLEASDHHEEPRPQRERGDRDRNRNSSGGGGGGGRRNWRQSEGEERSGEREPRPQQGQQQGEREQRNGNSRRRNRRRGTRDRDNRREGQPPRERQGNHDSQRKESLLKGLWRKIID